MTETTALAGLSERLARVSDLYAARCSVERDPDWYLLKLQEELGELTAAYLSLSGRGRSRGGEAEGRAAMADEAADVLAHVLLFCRSNNIRIDAALERKWFGHLDSEPAP